MSNELEFLSRRVAAGRMSRRDFLGRAAALGVTATFANTLLTSVLAELVTLNAHIVSVKAGGASSLRCDEIP
jgi:secreted PhoX family phosphatase